MKQFILCLSLVVLSFSYTYKIQSESDCIEFDPTYKVCSKWSQSGTIEQDTAACFIGETLVKQQSKGFIQMKQLTVGDKILTMKNGQEIWSQVQGWIHKNENSVTKYLNLTLQNGEWFGVSEKHNIAFQNKDNVYEYGFPSQSRVENLYPSSLPIASKETFTYQGKYAPLTSQSSYLIYTSKSHKPVLVHDFANISNPENYEFIANMIFSTSKIFNGEHILNSDGVHVAADWMMDNFGFLME